jgi:hypothetical protein
MIRTKEFCVSLTIRIAWHGEFHRPEMDNEPKMLLAVVRYFDFNGR